MLLIDIPKSIWLKLKIDGVLSNEILIFLFLTIRFSISLFTNLEFTTNMTYSPYRNISDLIKPDILPLLLLSIIFLFSGKSPEMTGPSRM